MTNFVLGDDVTIQEGAVVGHIHQNEFIPTRIGPRSIIRRGSIVYCNVVTGENFQTGHNTLIREETTIGNHVMVGTNSVIDGQVEIGSFVKIETNCYIPAHTTIGSRVFFGPGVTITNDRYPLKMREDYKKNGPEQAVIEDLVTIGGAATICPGIRIGRGSFVAAGAVVTKDIPEMSFVIGVPAIIKPLPKKLQEPNMALSWHGLLEC